MSMVQDVRIRTQRFQALRTHVWYLSSPLIMYVKLRDSCPSLPSLHQLDIAFRLAFGRPLPLVPKRRVAILGRCFVEINPRAYPRISLKPRPCRGLDRFAKSTERGECVGERQISIPDQSGDRRHAADHNTDSHFDDPEYENLEMETSSPSTEFKGRGIVPQRSRMKLGTYARIYTSTLYHVLSLWLYKFILTHRFKQLTIQALVQALASMQ